MRNAELFQRVFGMYATELWAKPEAEFLVWLNKEIEQAKIHDMLGDGTLIVTAKKGTKVGRVFVEEEGTRYGTMFYPDGQDLEG